LLVFNVKLMLSKILVAKVRMLGDSAGWGRSWPRI
jgi:hypothetical protein